MLLILQTGTAFPQRSCAHEPAGQHHDSAISAKYGDVPGSEQAETETWRDVHRDTAPVSDSCAATVQCALDPPAHVSAARRFQSNVQVAEESGPTWFLHVAPTTHATPPPKT